MKKIIKKLVVAGLTLTLSVTSLFAAQTIKCYGAEYPSWADGPRTELVDQNANGGTRIIKDVVVKNGVAFVNIEELAEKYGYLNVSPFKEYDDMWFGTNQRQEEVIKGFDIAFDCTYANKTVDSKYTYILVSSQQPALPLTKIIYSADELRAAGFTEEMIEEELSGNSYSTSYSGTFTATNKPFFQNGKLYVPAKLFITLINNDATTSIKYNADNNTITFEDRLCAPIYKCIGYWLRKDGKVTEYNLDGTVKSVTQVDPRYIQ